MEQLEVQRGRSGWAEVVLMQLHSLHGRQSGFLSAPQGQTSPTIAGEADRQTSCSARVSELSILQPLRIRPKALAGPQQLLILKVVPLVAQIEAHRGHLEKIALVSSVRCADPVLSAYARDRPGTWTDSGARDLIRTGLDRRAHMLCRIIFQAATD